MTTHVYMDHNATTPLCHAARDAMMRAMDVTGNASSVHGFGRTQRKIVEDAREKVAALAGVSVANVVFTSGGSEANNAILRSATVGGCAVSEIEHASVLNANGDAKRIPVTSDGMVDLDKLGEIMSALGDKPWISVMAANNETGVVQPIEAIASMVHGAGGRLHVDAVQAAGKLALPPIVALADAISLSAHKIGGPQGVGALIIKDGVVFEPTVRGGGQERRRRAGTENTIGIAGFGAACSIANDLLECQAQIGARRDRLEMALGSLAEVYGANAKRLANTSCLRMPGVSAETQVMAFDLAGIAVSAGSACSSGKVEPSHVLLAMGVPESSAGEAIRVSLGMETTDQDVDTFIDVWRRIQARAGSEAA